jgi:hypothetical protein
VSCNDNFPANLVRNSMLATKLDHGRGSGDAKARLHGTRLVVDARVNDTAVVSALMAGNAVFFLDQQEAKVRKAPRDFERDSEPYYATANDDYVVPGIGH